MTQSEWVRTELLKGRVLTPIDALDGCGCFRLAARIAELRTELSIETLSIHLPNGKVVAGYQLQSKEKEQACH